MLSTHVIAPAFADEYRTYWFELFETVRKVLIVGVPSVFPGRGGTPQLFWGLLVCFGEQLPVLNAYPEAACACCSPVRDHSHPDFILS